MVSSLLCILIYSKSEEEHFLHLKLVLDVVRKDKLYVNLKKCRFLQDGLLFLGFLISRDGMRIHDEKVKVILEWPIP